MFIKIFKLIICLSTLCLTTSAVQTDDLPKIKCGAKDGVKMIFDTVEVVNHLNPVNPVIYIEKVDQLDDQLRDSQRNYDKIENEKTALKPTLPETFQRNYDKIVNEKTALKALMEEKKRLAKENEITKRNLYS